MDQNVSIRLDRYVDTDMSPTVRQVLMHLCEGDHPSVGSIVEWCETRGDCAHAVVCPHCGAHYLVDEDEMAELLVISINTEEMLSCGVRFE